MATRSDIIAKLSDGRWKRLYCHSDGYLEHNGKILFESYTIQDKVDALMKPGDLSVLGPLPTKPKGHTFATPVAGHCVYYGRDRSEEDVDGTVGQTLLDVWPEDEESMHDFSYVWDGSAWWVSEGDFDSLTCLSDALNLSDKSKDQARVISVTDLNRSGVIAAEAALAKNPLWGAFA